VNYRNIENPGLPTALIVATRKNHIEIVKYLLSKGASTELTNLQNFTALGIATDNGLLQVMHLLLVNGANVNHLNAEGQSPLHIAAYQGCIFSSREITRITPPDKEATKLLLSHKGVQLELKDATGNTPLIVACISDAPDVVTLLLESGASIPFDNYN
jgi:ankyrin repeat protein